MTAAFRFISLNMPRGGIVRRQTYICLRLMEGADIYQIAKNCRTSVEMILRRAYQEHDRCGGRECPQGPVGRPCPKARSERKPREVWPRRRVPEAPPIILGDRHLSRYRYSRVPEWWNW